MKLQNKKLKDLIPMPDNVRWHPGGQVEEIKRSVEQFGQIRPIVVDDNNHIIIGNGLFIALNEMGWDKADVFVMEGISDADAKRLMLADNKIYELGTIDQELRDKAIRGIKEETGVFDIPGFTDGVLEAMFSDNQQVDDMLDDYGSMTASGKKIDSSENSSDEVEGADRNHEDSEKEVEIMNENVQLDENGKPFIKCDTCEHCNYFSE